MRQVPLILRAWAPHESRTRFPEMRTQTANDISSLAKTLAKPTPPRCGPIEKTCSNLPLKLAPEQFKAGSLSRLQPANPAVSAVIGRPSY